MQHQNDINPILHLLITDLVPIKKNKIRIYFNIKLNLLGLISNVEAVMSLN